MLFDSSLRKELGRSFGATLVVLVTIVMTVLLIRVLRSASHGQVNPSEVMLVMGFTVLGHLATILTLSLFIAITATLTRLYAGSEMVVWFASGQGLLAFLRPILRFAWPVLLAVAVLALLVWPWANVQIRQLQDRYQGRGDIERVAPGRFIESQGGQRVFFIDKDRARDDTGRNIFISAQGHGQQSVTTAQGGRLHVEDGQRFLVLEHGHQLETNPETQAVRLSEFAEYGQRLDARAQATGARAQPVLQTTAALLADESPRARGELSWRLGLATAAFNCVLLALAATRVNPRMGRSAGMVFSLFAFIAYYNMLNVGQGWVAQGRIGMGALMLALHGGICALALLWLLARHHNWALGMGRRAHRAPQGQAQRDRA